MATTAITSGQGAQQDVRWVSAAVLAALAARGLGKGDKFTSQDLLAWVPGLKAERKRTHATTTLCRLGFVTYKQRKGWGEYTVTAVGAEAVLVAAQGQLRKSGPKGPHGHRNAARPHSLAARLWALIRARKLLDADTAASLLVDAGADVATAAKTISRYLYRWAGAGYLQESAQRVGAVGTGNGFKRYVLVKDCGPTPPSLNTNRPANGPSIQP